MRYIKVDNDKFIEYNEDNNSTRVIIKSEVERQLAGASKRLSEIKKVDDKDLLAWARENYPAMDYSREKESLEKIINENNILLNNLKDGI